MGNEETKIPNVGEQIFYHDFGGQVLPAVVVFINEKDDSDEDSITTLNMQVFQNNNNCLSFKSKIQEGNKQDQWSWEKSKTEDVEE